MRVLSSIGLLYNRPVLNRLRTISRTRIAVGKKDCCLPTILRQDIHYPSIPLPARLVLAVEWTSSGCLAAVSWAGSNLFCDQKRFRGAGERGCAAGHSFCFRAVSTVDDCQSWRSSVSFRGSREDVSMVGEKCS